MGLHGDETAPVRWRFANAEYSERNHELVVAGEPVALEPKPLEVLLCLLRAEGELVTKQELFDTVSAGRVVTDGVLSQAIRRIREVLGDADRSMVRTVHGYGFRLDVPIEIEGRDDPGTRLELEPGQSLPNLPNWRLEQRLQTRPANELWRIRHVQNGQLRVVKLALDERAQRALKREVTLNKVLRAEMGEQAPLVPVLEWQFDSSPAWIQMPWYEQGSLADWLQAQGGVGTLPLPRRLNIVVEAAQALAQAHGLGVMHKDIKPGNLLVEQSGKEPRLLLCDFGSGTIKSRERLEQAGVTVMGFTKTVHDGSSTSGTPAYMAPEVLKGGVFSEQSDVYALGVLLYQLVIADLNEPLAPGWEEDVSDPGLRAIIAEACAGKRARRIPGMAEFAQRLSAWQPGVAGEKRPTPPTRREWGLRGGLALVTTLLLIMGGVWFLSEVQSDPEAFPPEPGTPIPGAETQGRVAILPFELLGLDEQTETVMGGLQDALIADMANFVGMRVIPGNNLAALGLDEAPASRIGEALRVEQLVRGSIQQVGEQLRVNLQLVSAASGDTTWGQVIQGTRSKLFEVQADIAQALANALGIGAIAPAGETVDNEAYAAYLAALSLWKQGHGHDQEMAVELNRALELAPGFVDAHLLALLAAARNYWFSTITRSEAETLIARHLDALEKQNTPPFKLATARAVRRYYLDHEPAGGVEILAPFRRHLIRNTESALFYAYMLRRIGRFDEALEILDQVADRDPSAMIPLETKAEVLTYLGRGGEAVTLLAEVGERTRDRTHAHIKLATFGYLLTGDLRFVQRGRVVLQQQKTQSEVQYHADLEIARKQGDLAAVRQLARGYSGEDKSTSGHGRMPWELDVALALRAGNAPADEVQGYARTALEKIQRWRAESDSDARRSIMAVILALLGQSREAVALSAQVEAEYPMARDYLESADRLLEAALVHALLGNTPEVLARLHKLASSRFITMNLCTVPYEQTRQAIWDLPVAREFISAQCTELWERNRRDVLPLLSRLPG